MRRWKQHRIWLHGLLVFGLLAGVAGCTKDNNKGAAEVKESTDPVALTRQGWSAFEAQDWDTALDKFERAIKFGASTSDAYSGAGWTYYMIGGNDSTAQVRWDDGLGLVGSYNDIKVGLGFLAFDQGRFQDAIDQFEAVEADNPSYRFIHLDGLNIDDLYLTLAESYYMLSDFATSLEYVQHLNPVFTADLSTREGVQALAAEIERLDREIVRG